MSSKTKSLQPLGRPSSPRKFFARLYGHLETNKDDNKIIKSTNEKSSNQDLHLHDQVDPCNEEVTEIQQRLSDENPNTLICKPKVTWSKIIHEDNRKSERSSNLPLLGLPLFSQGFFPSSSTNSVNLTHQNSLQHFHGLPIHGQSVHHLHGFSAFRKYIIFSYKRMGQSGR